MDKVFIGIGTNVGDRRTHLEYARQALSALPRTTLARWSQMYETEPVGPVAQGPFLNAAAELHTELSPSQLLAQLNAIESNAGRPPTEKRVKWGPRVLDLDILLWEGQVISRDDLIVPHPLMHERWFVLKPLADIASDAVHPLLQMTVGALLRYVEEDMKASTGKADD